MNILIKFLLLSVSSILFSSEYPNVFNSAGDEIYKSTEKYIEIKSLDIYKNKPEFLEAFCEDSKASMEEGFSLDKMQSDAEESIDKQKIKSYVKRLRDLSRRNESILLQIKEDIQKVYRAGDFESLKTFERAGFDLSAKMHRALRDEEAKVKQEAKDNELKESIDKLNEKSKKNVPLIEQAEAVSATDVSSVKQAEAVSATDVSSVKQDAPDIEANVSSSIQEKLENESKPVSKKELTELEFYQQSMVDLKNKLYTMRESSDETQMLCLNDITAINYWMIKVLENEKNACELVDSIKQMKTYDKSAFDSCGETSMRYVEWHGRIKKYVGSKLFEAEAICKR